MCWVEAEEVRVEFGRIAFNETNKDDLASLIASRQRFRSSSLAANNISEQ